MQRKAFIGALVGIAVLSCAAVLTLELARGPRAAAECVNVPPGTRDIVLAGTTARLQIPAAFLRHPWSYADGVSERAIYAIAELPDFHPVTTCNRSMLSENGALRVAQILITPKLDLTIATRIEHLVNRPLAEILEHAVEDRNGLKRVDLKSLSRATDYTSRIYIPTTTGEMSFYIRCSSDRPPAPRCGFYYDIDDMTVNLTVPQAYVSQRPGVLDSSRQLVRAWLKAKP